MYTAYIGPLTSVNETTGREIKTELRIEPADPAYGDRLALGLYGFNSGSEIRTALLTRNHAIELIAALREFTTPPQKEN